MLLDDISNEKTDNKFDNQRKEDRRHLIYYLRVLDQKNNEEIGRVVDITQNGVLLISKEKFDNKEEMAVRIELGNELFEKMNGHLDLHVQCRWSKPDINPHYFVNGFVFLGHTKRETLLIDKLIDLIGFRD